MQLRWVLEHFYAIIYQTTVNEVVWTSISHDTKWGKYKYLLIIYNQQFNLQQENSY